MIGKVGGVLPKMIATENDVAAKASGPDFAIILNESPSSRHVAIVALHAMVSSPRPVS